MDFKIHREPYEKGQTMYARANISFEPGITILVGCNGSGKSTLIKSIKGILKDKDIPYISFDNLSEGNMRQAESLMLFGGNSSYLASAASMSEGERIYMNIGLLVSKIQWYVKRYEGGKKEFFLIGDALDSGSSIDNILEIKDAFQMIINDLKENYGFDTYVILSTNNYELAADSDCFDVASGKHISFKDYEDYKKFILKSRCKKDRREDRFNVYIKKENEKKEAANRKRYSRESTFDTDDEKTKEIYQEIKKERNLSLTERKC